MRRILMAFLLVCSSGLWLSAQPAPDVKKLMDENLPPLSLASVISAEKMAEFQKYSINEAAKNLQDLRKEGLDKEFAGKFCAYLLKGLKQDELREFLNKVGLPLEAGEISYLNNFIVDGDNFPPYNDRILKDSGYRLQAKVLDDDSIRLEILVLKEEEKNMYFQASAASDWALIPAEMSERLFHIASASEGLIILGTDNAALPVIRAIEGK